MLKCTARTAPIKITQLRWQSDEQSCTQFSIPISDYLHGTFFDNLNPSLMSLIMSETEHALCLLVICISPSDCPGNALFLLPFCFCFLLCKPSSMLRKITFVFHIIGRCFPNIVFSTYILCAYKILM